MTVFETLNSLNVNGHTEKKRVDGKTELTYLSWPWAWAEVKKRYPDAHYEIKRNKNGVPYVCDPTTGYMVFTSVTIEGVTHDMWLPVMDGANNAMRPCEYQYKVKNPNFKWARQGDDGKYYDKFGNEQHEYNVKTVKAATMFDINKTIMRCLVKNLAMFGLGLYIYAGEDLPEGEAEKALDEAQNDIPEDAVTADTVLELPVKQSDEWRPRLVAATWASKHGMTMMQFAEARNAVVAAKLVIDTPVGELTESQLKTLFEAIERNIQKGA